jgi:type II secretory pathway pseudopilin PulG
MRNQCSKFSDGFTLLEVLIGALILAGVMIGISRVSISALTGNSIEQKRGRIEAEINSNMQLIQQANRRLTLESIPPLDRDLACSAPEAYLISRINQTGATEYVPRPTMAERTLSINAFGDGWDVIEVAYRFQAPEQAIATEQRMVELHPTFAPRCP